jgi:hypothetical protein
MPKRKRNLDDDAKPATGSKRIKILMGSSSTRNRLQEMPQELFDMVSAQVALGRDERAAARDLAVLERLGKGIQANLANSPAAKYRESLNEAGKAATRNYSMLPRGGFREGGQVSPAEYVGMIGPGIHLLSSDDQAEIITMIQRIRNDWTKATALNAIASYSHRLSPDHVSALLDSAIEVVEQRDGTNMPHGCRAIAKLHSFRTPIQNARIAKLRNRDLASANEIDAELDATERRDGTLTTAENTPSPTGDNSQVHEDVTVRQRVENATIDLLCKVSQADKAFEALSKSSKPEVARAALRETPREREGRG